MTVLTMNSRIACIGSRDLSAEQTAICEKLGAWVVQCGHTLHTGNASGADQAFARGANQIRPDLVHLHLPWPMFEGTAIHAENVVHNLNDMPEHQLNMYKSVAYQHHPAWGRLSQGVHKLMLRNSSIMIPTVVPEGPGFKGVLVDMCLALPSNKRGGGGTGQGMRIAQNTTIRLVDLRGYEQPQLFELCQEIAQL